MPRLMYDSTSPWDIPRDAKMVAYYVDGRYAWPREWLDLFPQAIKVSISAIGARTAQVGDVEVGCIWPPANAVPWVRRARADGYDPTIYVNELNDWLPVRQAFWAAGEPEPHYWVARYNGVREIPPGAVARQFAHPHDGDGVANNPWETGAHYDLSIVADYWPGVDGGAPGGGGGAGRPKNVTILGKGPGPEVWAIGAEGRRHVKTEKEANGFIAGGAPTVNFTQAELNGIPLIGELVMNYNVPTTLEGMPPLRTDGQFEPFHRVVANINQRVAAVIADVDEAALAVELERLGIGGATPAQVKEAVNAALAAGVTKFTPGDEG